MPRDPKTIKSTKNRRGNNEGSIYERTDGRWCAQVTTGYTEEHKPIRKYIYGKTRQEVAKQLSALTNDVFTSGYMKNPDDDATVETFLREWLFNFKKPKITDTTFLWYMRYANTHIIPVIGSMKISAVEPIHVQKLLNGMINNKRAARTVNGVRQTLGQMFRFAVENDILSKNPVEFTTGMSKRKEQRDKNSKVLTPEQRQAVLAAAENHPILKPMVKTLMFTGMRIGELLALRWRHVNFEAGTITIEDAVIREYDFDENGKANNQRSLISFTKTQASVRTFKAAEIVMVTLRNHLNECAVNECEKGISFTAQNDFVFSTRKGELRTYQGFSSIFSRFKKDNGFTDFELHAHTMRHTFATILLEEGENPKTVQMLLGHKDVETTLGIYTHVLQSVFEDAAKKIDGAHNKLVPKVNHNQEHTNDDLLEKLKFLLSDQKLLGELVATKLEKVPV